MILKKFTLTVFAAALCYTPLVLGQQMAVTFDAAATKINWTLAGNIHTVHGTFQLKQGHLSVDTAAGIVSGELVVDAASGESGNASRDKRMLKDVLQSDSFPEVRLTVTKLEGPLPFEKTSDIRVVGQLKIHGASHEVSIPFQVTVNGSEVRGKGRFVLPYVDWGMKDPSNFLFKVNKTVEIDLEAVGQLNR